MEELNNEINLPAQPPQPEVKPYPDLNQSWVLFAVFIGVNLVLGMLMGVVIAVATALGACDLNAMPYGIFITYIICFSLVMTFAYYAAKKNNYKIKLSKEIGPEWLYLALLFFMPGMTILLDSFVSLFDLIPLPPMFDELVKKIQESIQNSVKINFMSFLTVVIAAPILEEILCRGIILDGLLKNREPKSAILWSAFIFAALHLNPWQGTVAFIIGYVAGWVFWKTRSLYACIFIHFLNNAIAFGAMYYAQNPSVSMREITGEYYLHVLLGAAFLVATAGYFIYKKLDNETIVEGV